MRRSYSLHPATLLVFLCTLVSPLAGQAPDSAAAPVPDSASLDPDMAAPEPTLPIAPLVTLGSVAEDRLRLRQILGESPTDGFLIRSPSTLTPPIETDSGEFRWRMIPPELSTVWNSDLPFSLNDGALWAGRGLNTQVMAGVRARAGRVSLIFAPQLIYQQNKPFQTIPYPFDDRSPFASPFHSRPESLDLPLRFGDQAFTSFDLGQSSLSVHVGQATAGVATEALWWGPGIRNAIVMSNNAAGIPHLFLRTRAPLQTRIGTVEGRWIVGRLRESEYFDFDSKNDYRSISALAATLRPAIASNLTVGITRAVYARSDNANFPLGSTLNVFRMVGSPNAWSAANPRRPSKPDQIFSLFGRWVFPESGLETYVEWARNQALTSPRDLLVSPNHSQGYTLGLQWAKPISVASAFRFQTEITYLEPSSTYRQQRVISWYASRPVPQGYTHRGQVIGAGIGPGASSQWIAADYVSRDWQIGLFGGRIRWDDAAFYTAVAVPTFHAHDVSVYGGVRGSYRVRGVDVQIEATNGERLNYLFQNATPSFERIPEFAVDVPSRTFRMSISPAARLR